MLNLLDAMKIKTSTNYLVALHGFFGCIGAMGRLRRVPWVNNMVPTVYNGARMPTRQSSQAASPDGRFVLAVEADGSSAVYNVDSGERKPILGMDRRWRNLRASPSRTAGLLAA